MLQLSRGPQSGTAQALSFQMRQQWLQGTRRYFLHFFLQDVGVCTADRQGWKALRVSSSFRVNRFAQLLDMGTHKALGTKSHLESKAAHLLRYFSRSCLRQVFSVLYQEGRRICGDKWRSSNSDTFCSRCFIFGTF